MTAFVVVNFQMSPGWMLWVLPTPIGAPVIRLTIRKYRKRFASGKAAAENAREARSGKRWGDHLSKISSVPA